MLQDITKHLSYIEIYSFAEQRPENFAQERNTTGIIFHSIIIDTNPKLVLQESSGQNLLCTNTRFLQICTVACHLIDTFTLND